MNLEHIKINRIPNIQAEELIKALQDAKQGMVKSFSFLSKTDWSKIEMKLSIEAQLLEKIIKKPTVEEWLMSEFLARKRKFREKFTSILRKRKKNKDWSKYNIFVNCHKKNG